MHTTENSGESGLAGSSTDEAGSVPHFHRVQEGGGQTESTPEVHDGGDQGDGLPSGGGGYAAAFYAPAWKPHPYQQDGIEWLATRPEGALFFPPGLGKTSTSLAASILLGTVLKKRVRMLVMAPLKVCQTTWMDEPTKWLQFSHLKVGLAHGPDKELVLRDEYYDVVVINYDGIAWAAPLLAKGHTFDILLFDELTRVKNQASRRFKLLKPILNTFRFRWGLTGTPTANGLLDLFGQMYCLDLGQTFGRYITHYRLKYFYKVPGDEFRWHISKDSARRITEATAKTAMYVRPEDWLKLPELITIPIDVTLEKKEHDAYSRLENDFILKLEDGAITAANAGVLSSKLRQFTGGAVYTEDGVFYEEFGTSKLDALESLVEELNGEPLLVAYNFDHERQRILKRYPDAVVIKGGMTAGQVQLAISKWNAGLAPIMLVQPQAAAHGLNLQFGGACMCWYSLTFNLEDYLQLIARIYRQGQVQRVRNYVLLAKKTIDTYVYKVLNTKDATQMTFFDALRTLAKNKS